MSSQTTEQAVRQATQDMTYDEKLKLYGLLLSLWRRR